MPEPIRQTTPLVWRAGAFSPGERLIPEETAVALTYGRATYAVMMASPADLEDFAVGFSLNEGLIAAAGEIEELEVVEAAQGVELRMSLAHAREDEVFRRRRHLTGATGCGLCGMESLDEAMRPPPRVAGDLRVSAEAIVGVMAAIGPLQALNRQTRAVHAAAFWDQAAGVIALREDVGRHNALDKLAGALARADVPGSRGVVLLTSRVSVEMVQKTARIGAPLLVAVSAPTALAVRVAEAAGITLAAVARADGYEVFTHPARILPRTSANVA